MAHNGITEVAVRLGGKSAKRNQQTTPGFLLREDSAGGINLHNLCKSKPENVGGL